MGRRFVGAWCFGLLVVWLAACQSAVETVGEAQPTVEPTTAPTNTAVPTVTTAPSPEPTAAPTELPPTPMPTAVVSDAEVHTLVAELPASTGGIAVDAAGNIYVADIGTAPSRRGKTVYKITPDGEVSVFVDGEGLRGASGNAFDSQGNLFQSSLSANTISKITPDGEVTVFAEDGIWGPVGIAIDDEDTLYVANCRANTIQRVTADGVSSLFAESNLFHCPNGIALDGAENVYVANFGDGRVLKITPDGAVSEFAELPGGNNGHITFDGETFYVVDRGGHQIYTLSLAGELTLFVGTGERGLADGPGLEATLSLPNDIAISPDGKTLYVNHVLSTISQVNRPSVIRKIVLTD